MSRESRAVDLMSIAAAFITRDASPMYLSGSCPISGASYGTGNIEIDFSEQQFRTAAPGHRRSSRACIQGSPCCAIYPLTDKIRFLVDVRLSRCGSQFCICVRWRPDIFPWPLEQDHVQLLCRESAEYCRMSLVVIPRGWGSHHANQTGPMQTGNRNRIRAA